MKKILLAILFLFLLAIIGISIFIFAFPVKIKETAPEANSQEVATNASVYVKFNKPVERQSLNHKISPEAFGEWSFGNPLVENHLFTSITFKPAVPLKDGTEYEIKLSGLTTPFPLEKGSSGFSFSFKTAGEKESPVPEEKENETENEESSQQEEESPIVQSPAQNPGITLIDIPLDWQDYSLSCEAASLKMALASKKVFVSEEEIMDEVGYDLSPRTSETWGNPNKAYVGNIDGEICKTGYGVHWEPIAKAARKWREAEIFSRWDIKGLTEELSKGNPAVIWGTLPVKNPKECSWKTSGGESIRVFWETHVRLAIGFIGEKENPSKIIINDPLSGRLYWPTGDFLVNWGRFNRNAVVVR